MKKIIALLTALLMVLTLAGCKDKLDSVRIFEEEKLVVGVTNYEPMDYLDENGEWTGFDAEFARAVGEKMGVEIEFVEIKWENKFIELNSGKIDCIWNGMTISDDVLANTSCSKAYVINRQVVVMAADKVDQYKDVESLKSLSFAVEKGSAGATAAEDNGLENVVEVDGQTSALMEVGAGKVDACIIDGTMASTTTGEGTDYANLAVGLALTEEEYGIGFRKDSDLTDKINGYIDELKADGTLPALAEKYGLTLAD